MGTAADGSLRFRAVSPGLSVFAIGGPAAQQETPDDEPTTLIDDPAMDEPGTPTSDGTTADPGDMDESPTSSSPGQPGFGFAIALLAMTLTGLLAVRRRT